jgi:hypothetical protein
MASSPALESKMLHILGIFWNLYMPLRFKYFTGYRPHLANAIDRSGSYHVVGSSPTCCGMDMDKTSKRMQLTVHDSTELWLSVVLRRIVAGSGTGSHGTLRAVPISWVRQVKIAGMLS